MLEKAKVGETASRFEKINFTQPFPFTHGEELERMRLTQIQEYRRDVLKTIQEVHSRQDAEIGNLNKDHLRAQMFTSPFYDRGKTWIEA